MVIGVIKMMLMVVGNGDNGGDGDGDDGRMAVTMMTRVKTTRTDRPSKRRGLPSGRPKPFY